MAKKYLTLDEAADRLAISKDELVKLRESGDIRGFADRGNWKFKIDDVEELARSRSADSNPDVPIISESQEPDDLEDSVVLSGFGEGLESSDSDIRLVLDSEAEEGAGESSMVIQEGEDSDSDINLVGNADSDSDVKLVGEADSDSDVKLVESDSDSDVKLVETADSDSDIQIAPDDVDEPTDSDVALVDDLGDSDSDIRLASEDLGGSDSDVRLVSEDSGSDIALAPDFGSDSDVRLVADADVEGSDSDVQLIDSSTADTKTSDSDIAIISSDDSAITLDLDPEDSGSILADESGVEVGGDSSITLASESGISLEGPADSGISLDLDGDEGITLADDSGISLGEAGDSGIALAQDSGDLGGTMPMMETVDDDDVAETQFEIPSLSGEESEFDLDSIGDDGDTGVLDLDDSGELDDAVFDVDEEESAEVDALSDELELDDDFDDDSDMDDLDVFEDDSDYEEGFQTGESHGELVLPTRAAAVEADWGTGPFVGLILSTTLLAVVGIVMADLVRSMWSWNEPNAVAGSLLGIFGGLF